MQNTIPAGTSKVWRLSQIRIGNISLPNPVLLAPMSGITDAPFRRLAARLGAGLTVSEMTVSKGLCAGEGGARRRIQGARVGVEAVWVSLDRLTACEVEFLDRWWRGCREHFPELAGASKSA